MNILYIFGYKYSLQVWKDSGALERELNFFNKMWKDHQAKYTLITYGNSNDLDINLPDNIEVLPMFPKSAIKKSSLKMFIKSLIFPFMVYKQLCTVDVIKTNQLNGSWIAITFKFLLKKPLFIRTGFDQLLFAKNDNKNKLKILFFYLLTGLSLKFSNIYSVTSKSDIDFLSKRFKNSTKIIYRPNWVSTELQLTKFTNRNINFLSAGRLENQKNFKLLIKAFVITNEEIRIVGSGSKKLELQKLAKSLNVNLTLIPNLSHKDFLLSLRNVKFFILPSLYEGNPKVLIEAMGMGCIPIVSDITNHTEIIKNGVNGLIFKSDDVESLKSVINRAQKLSDVQELSTNSVNTVLKKNSLEKIAALEYEDYLFLKQLQV